MASRPETCIRVRGGAARAMEEAEGFFIALGASIVEREVRFMRAVVSHPDGFQSHIAVSYTGEDEVLHLHRRSGDPTLFEMLCAMFVDFDMGCGKPPTDFFDGQILPMIVRKCSPPPVDAPPLCLDGVGVKRKLAEACL